MNNITDKQIIKWIEEQRFSDLTFLDYDWKYSKNEKVIGFYYFIQDLKNESTREVLKEIVKRNKSESSAYLYLGKIANEIYNSFDKYHISESFYRKSVELDGDNSDALWRLYKVTNNNDQLALKSIFIDFESGNYDEIKWKLRNIYPCFNQSSNFSKEQWRKLKCILLDEGVKHDKEFLISTYFYLSEFNEGVILIEKANKLSFNVIKPYYDYGFFDISKITEKVYDFERDNLFLNDPLKVYQENILQFGISQNPTVIRIIQLAFRAEQYVDVIKYFKNNSGDDAFFPHDKASKLYYLLSQLFIDTELDCEVLSYIKNCSHELRDEEKLLYELFHAKLEIKNIMSTVIDKDVNYNISFDGRYQRIQKLLSGSDVYKHYLFQGISDELSSLKDEWDNMHKKFNLEELRIKLEKDEIEYDDFLQLLSLSISCKEYDFVIENVMSYHDKYRKTASTYNYLGVCYERSGDINKAYENYKYALDFMLESKENNHTIIYNYISAFEKSKCKKLDVEEYNDLRHLCNISLANEFTWRTFTSKKRNTLFKYQPFNINAIDSLMNKYFYLASKEQLNDPIEMPSLERVGKDNLMSSDFRICSLTNNYNSMLMWSHYAQQHEGIMVEYWFGGELPDGVGIDGIKYYNDNKRENEKDLYVFNQYLLTKNKEWSYENEVRLFSYKESKIYYDLYNYPYHDRSKINAVITSITLGYKFPQDKVSMIKNIITQLNDSRREEDSPIILRKTVLSKESQFAIEYQELSLN